MATIDRATRMAKSLEVDSDCINFILSWLFFDLRAIGVLLLQVETLLNLLIG